MSLPGFFAWAWELGEHPAGLHLIAVKLESCELDVCDLAYPDVPAYMIKQKLKTQLATNRPFRLWKVALPIDDDLDDRLEEITLDLHATAEPLRLEKVVCRNDQQEETFHRLSLIAEYMDGEDDS